MHSRGTYYEHGDRASRLLAHQLKRSVVTRLIPQIKDSTHLIFDTTGINDTFKSFYSSLYMAEFPPHTANMTTFLGELETPTVETVDYFNSPLNLDEVIQSIKSM